jgi:UDP-2,4-diacetamido-2,4,6-trideoxy-beta-L-altropyranose hydrolase
MALNRMNIMLRVDSSDKIGTGHVVRCLTLAIALNEEGVAVRFMCRPLAGNIIPSIEAKGFEVVIIQNGGRGEHSFSKEDCKWEAMRVAEVCTLLGVNIVILDHYFLDNEWERVVRLNAKLMCISDIPSRFRSCDLLVDQSLFRIESDYQSLVNRDCELLLGPDYAIVRPEFAACRKEATATRDPGEIGRVLITMGGSDPDDFTSRILNIISRYSEHDLSGIVFELILGRSYRYLQRVDDVIGGSKLRFTTHRYVDNMAAMMSSVDLVITSAGTTLWECFTLGLPAIAVQIADNQSYNIESAVRAEAVIGCNSEASLKECLAQSLSDVFSNNDVLAKLRENSRAICDGLGTDRMVSAITRSFHG